MGKKRVLIVDDSAVVRQVLSGIVDSDPGLEVMGAVADPIFALRRLQKEWPDVIILDVEMPRMDGISFLKKLMSERPTPVVMCSTLTVGGTETCLQAIAAGAVEVIEKPRAGGRQGLAECAAIVLDAVKSAAQARMDRHCLQMAPARATGDTRQQLRQVQARLSADAMLRYQPQEAMQKTTERIVAIGTSTGGTQALQDVLPALPRATGGLLIVQHMPEKFTAAFAQRLNGLCRIEVREARDGDRVLPGCALIAPGGRHMMLKRNGAQYQVHIKDGPLVSRHRPSVDVLFRSVAQYAGRNAMGIIMTGMGDDGAAGLREMHQAGARTLAQDEDSCVVYGMPKEAVKRGCVDQSVSLAAIPEKILAFGASM